MAGFSKSEEKEQIYKNLGKPDSKVEKLFESMKDVYMMAFLLGALDEKKVPIKKKGDPIKDVYFDEDDKLLMDLVALDMTKDINILKKKEDSNEYIHQLVEEYANGGIEKLEELFDGEYFDIDKFVSIIKGYEKVSKPKTVELEDLFEFML